jgi:hypothetical protein
MEDNTNYAKRIILEFLDYIRYKVENDRLTLEEADTIAKTLQGEMRLTGTADDFSRFYGKTKTNVTTVIDRKMLSKPRRMVMHSFNEFRNAVPSGWYVHKE